MGSLLRGRGVVGACVLGLCLMMASPAWAVLNNGFETDWVYMIRHYEEDGNARIFNESTGTIAVADWWPGREDGGTAIWTSLTFSGTESNDARAFVIRPNPGWETNPPGTATDVIIAELNSNAGPIKTANLGVLTGVGANNLGPNVLPHHIRYSSYHNSLFIGVNLDKTSSTALKVYEVNLALDTVLNTYTGPAVGDDLVEAIVNPDNGDLYVISEDLNGAGGTGDLIAFDTSGGSTSSYTPLIEAGTLADPDWSSPQALACRGTYNPSNRPTILVFMKASGPGTQHPVLEFYLDEVDGNGNLVKRGEPTMIEVGMSGQLDRVCGLVWIARGANDLDNEEMVGLASDDTEYVPGGPRGRRWCDAASPYSSEVPPVIEEVAPDPDEAVVGTEYIKQLTLWQGTPPVKWTLVQGPAGAQVDETTGRVYGWTPTLQDAASNPLVTFEVQASNDPIGADTEVWQVSVLNNGFRKDWVYMIRSYEEDGNIRIFRKETGQIAVADWTPPLDEPGAVAWSSLTFAGTGDNDARLFVTKADPDWPTPPFTDIIIGELDASAGLVKTAKLGAMAGLGANNLGTSVVPHHVRYSAFHNSLFIPVNPDKTTGTPLKVYEVDLSLSTVLNVYTGPPVLDDAVDVAINPQNGDLYVVSANLNGSGGQGDLIAFDTSGGSTSSSTTLIDGATLGDGNWSNPIALAYRGKNNACYRPTILVIQKGTGEGPWPVLEFYLDQADANGNLLKRGEPISVESGWGGQLDVVTGIVWLAGLAGPTDMVGLLPDDTEWRPGPFSTRAWLDAATPGGSLLRPPPCNLDVFADADRDGDVDQADFALFQACFTGAGSFTLSDDCKCFDRSGDGELTACDGDIDNWDYGEFEACATGPQILFDLRNPPPGCHP